jgi:hypothetical protein
VLTSGLVTGIRPGDLDGAPTFETIQPKIKALLEGKIVVGHALWNDLAVSEHPAGSPPWHTSWTTTSKRFKPLYVPAG